MCKFTAFKKASSYIVPCISTKNNCPKFRKLIPSFYNQTYTIDYTDNLLNSEEMKLLEFIKTPLIKLNLD